MKQTYQYIDTNQNEKSPHGPPFYKGGKWGDFQVLFFCILAFFIFDIIAAGSAVCEDGGEEVVARPNVEYKAEDLKDPFEGPVLKDTSDEVRPIPAPGGATEGKEAQPPPLIVQGLMWGGDFPLAIINNKVVKAGDPLEGGTVVSIDKDGVIFIFEGKQYKLSAPMAGSVSSDKS